MEENEATSLLSRLISIDSVFPRERTLAEYCANYLGNCGFSVKLQEFAPNRFNVIAQKGERDGSLLLSAHLDTVPPYNYGKRNPLKMETDRGRIQGLGCWDMKSGLALVLLCAKYSALTSRGLRIILTADEENISEGTWSAVKSGEYAGAAFCLCHEIPDTPEDEHRSNTAANASQRNGASNASPASGANTALPSARPPLILGRRGRVVYRFTVKGIGAHGAGTGGVSAVYLGMKLASALEQIQMPTGRTGPCRLFIRKFSSESTSLAIPTEATLEADVHYVPPYTNETFLAYLKTHLAGLQFPSGCSWSVEIPVRKTPYLPAYETDSKNPLVAKFLSLYKENIGNPEISYGLTVADENVLSTTGIPIVTLGPLGGGAHSSEEWLSEKDFLLLAEKVPKIVQSLL
ncbi:MAG: M20/M25/M40 family metallo-hydrolase [Candidatus Micrarchaeia archaeon]